MPKEMTDQEAVKFLLERINDAIDKWHALDSTETLAEYLGMSEEGYAHFVKDPEGFARRLLNIQEKPS